MTPYVGNLARSLVAAPFKAEKAQETIGSALWLYVWLVALVNSTGHVCRTTDTLGHDLAVTEDQIDAWLATLVDAGLIRIHTPKPFLVLKLASWPDSDACDAPNRIENSGQHAAAPKDVPVSSSLQQAAAEQSNKQEDGGAGEGEALLRAAEAILTPADSIALRQLVEAYPARIVDQALQRVAAVPAGQIRKSKLALFRYLLTKLTNESHATPQSHHA